MGSNIGENRYIAREKAEDLQDSNKMRERYLVQAGGEF
jgi:hypothetical protein